MTANLVYTINVKREKIVREHIDHFIVDVEEERRRKEDTFISPHENLRASEDQGSRIQFKPLHWKPRDIARSSHPSRKEDSTPRVTRGMKGSWNLRMAAPRYVRKTILHKSVY